MGFFIAQCRAAGIGATTTSSTRLSVGTGKIAGWAGGAMSAGLAGGAKPPLARLPCRTPDHSFDLIHAVHVN